MITNIRGWARERPGTRRARRSKWRFGLAALIALAGASTAGAQAPQRLSIVDAVDAALARFPSVAASTARKEAAEAATARASAAWWPSVRVGASATQYEEPMLVSPIHGLTPGGAPSFDETLYKGWGELTYTLFDGGARGARIREGRELSAAAGEELASTRQELTRSVVATYLETLSRGGVLAAHESRIEALRAEADRVRQRLDAERASKMDLLRIEAALAGAEAERVRAASQLDVSARDLARLTGLPAEQVRPERLVPPGYRGPDATDRNALAGAALSGNPALEAARRGVAAAEARVSVARSARMPRADLAGAYTGYASVQGDSTGEWNLGVRVSMPLFAGGEISSGVDAAEAQRRAAAEGLRVAELQIAGQVDRAVSAVETARARVGSLEIAVSRSEEIVRIERLRLETGTGTQGDYLRAEADLLEARSMLIEARHGELASRVELARLSGRLDRSWLNENLEAAR